MLWLLIAILNQQLQVSLIMRARALTITTSCHRNIPSFRYRENQEKVEEENYHSKGRVSLQTIHCAYLRGVYSVKFMSAPTTSANTERKKQFIAFENAPCRKRYR